MLQRIIPDLESRLRRRCETLVGHHSSSQNSSSGSSHKELMLLLGQFVCREDNEIFIGQFSLNLLSVEP